MIGLLDINVLVALFDAGHVHHHAAHRWLAGHRALGWATCPITENGCIRVLSLPQYPGRLAPSAIAGRLQRAIAAPDHVFWPDTISSCDARRFHHDRILTGRHLNDLYLLALAAENRGRLVTFDQAIRTGAVAGATAEHLVILQMAP